MNRRMTIAAVLAGLVGLPLAVLAAPTSAEPAVDPQVPTARYLLQSDDPIYLGSKPGKKVARVTVINQEMDDNLTYDRDLKHVFFAGDGSPGVPWKFQEYRGSFLTYSYTTAGTYAPYIELTDEDGNTATIRPTTYASQEPVTVTVVRDDEAPTVAVGLPPAGTRKKVSSWRTVRGTAADVGSGIEVMRAQVLERRKGRWFVYDFDATRWRRGSKTYAATVKNLPDRYLGYAWQRAGNTWVLSGPLKGLTTGRLVIQVTATDHAGNVTRSKRVEQQLTRR